MRDNEQVRLLTETGFNGLWLETEDVRHRSRVWLARDDAIKIAAQMLCMTSVVGEGSSSVFAKELQRFRDGIGDLMDTLGEVRLAEKGESCSVCGRVIFNAANMSRHFAAHMKDGEVTT